MGYIVVHWRRFQNRLKKDFFSVEHHSKSYLQEKMYLKSDLSWNVAIPPEKFYADDGLMVRREILIELMASFAAEKATKDLGYYLAITTISKIGAGNVRSSGDVSFPVDFSCITFKVLVGEILEGVVHKVIEHRVFMRCGPAESVFLPRQKMGDYEYVAGENAPHFASDAESSSKIEKDVVLRCLVIGEMYDEVERDFKVVVSLDGDCLGPISRRSGP